MGSTGDAVAEQAGRSVIVVQCARLASKRVPKKPLQMIGGRPLLEWSLRAVKQAAQSESVEHRLIVELGESEIVEIANRVGVGLLPRSVSAARAASAWTSFIELREPLCKWDWVVYCNASFPFITPEDYAGFIQAAKHVQRAQMAMFRHHGSIWDDRTRLVYGSGTTHTRNNPPYCVPAHCFWALLTAQATRFGGDWRLVEFEPYMVPHRAEYRLDVDTPEDLRLARRWAEPMRYQDDIALDG